MGFYLKAVMSEDSTLLKRVHTGKYLTQVTSKDRHRENLGGLEVLQIAGVFS